MRIYTRSRGDWFRPRGYLHFDTPLGASSRLQVERLVRNPERVARHGFHPFISYNRTKYKIVEDEACGTRYLDDKGVRTLSYAAHADAHIYAYYAHEISTLYEAELRRLGLSEAVIAFRKLTDSETGAAKSNIHFAHDAFRAIQETGNCVVHTFDVTGFFDNLRAEHLKRSWVKLLGADTLPDDHFAVFKSMTAHSSVDRDVLYSTLGLPNDPPKTVRQICNGTVFRERVRGEGVAIDPVTKQSKRGLIITKTKGIPQGSPISGLLANIYMLNFDLDMNEKMSAIGGRYYRYCDDLFFLFPKHADFEIENWVSSKLRLIDLSLNLKKSDRSVFSSTDQKQTCDKPIQYLGFTFDGERSAIRASSISRYIRRLRASVRLARLTQSKYNTIRTKKGLPPTPLHRKKLFDRYAHTGDSNFITYGLRAASIMQSPTIRGQMKKMGKFLEKELATPLRH